MKKIFLCLVVVFLFSVKETIFAQAPNGGQMQQKMREFLKDTVRLSDAMTDSVIAIHKQFMMQMRQSSSASSDDKQAKMQTVRTQMEARFKTIGLTEEQIKMIEEHDRRMREQMRNKNGGATQQ